MTSGDSQPEKGLQIWYKCIACQDWFPIPHGFEAQEDGIDDDPFGGI